METMHGNSYDGHTINQAIANAEKLSQATIDQIFLDKGYKGAKIEGKEIYRSGQKVLKKHLNEDNP